MKNPLRRNGVWFTERYEVLEHGVAGTGVFDQKFRTLKQALRFCAEVENRWDGHSVRDRWEVRA